MLSLQKTDIACPNCHLIDWFVDGFVMAETLDGSVRRFRNSPGRDDTARWTCGGCGLVADDDSELAVNLRHARLAHQD